eukprot:7164076-Prymnesium_polylepis.1
MVPQRPQLAPPFQAGRGCGAHQLPLLRPDVGGRQGVERRQDRGCNARADQRTHVPRILRPRDQAVGHAAAAASLGRLERARCAG